MTSAGSPTLSPPMAYASNPIATVSAALSRRRSGKTPPCTMPNCAWLARGVDGRRIREALVEHHRDIGSQLRLDVDGLLGREEVRRSIEVRLKSRALFRDRPAGGQAEHLIAAAVGQDRFPPPDEPVKPASTCDEIVAGPKIQMVGVAEDHLGPNRFEIAVRDAFHRPLGADRHERRRVHPAVRCGHHAPPGAAVDMCHLKSVSRV
jgi:hypothetical protein